LANAVVKVARRSADTSGTDGLAAGNRAARERRPATPAKNNGKECNMAQESTDTSVDCTVRFSYFRGECYSQHADGSGAWIGEWRNTGDAAQADCDAHDKACHDSVNHAKVEFR
jgi:hypothetical protein